MKTVDLEKEDLNLETLLSLAGEGPVLLLAADGKEYFVSEADDFDKEVEALRASSAFQRFLDDRSANKRRVPLSEIEKEIEKELEEQKQTA
ncbi:MAG: hypothetical protein L0229_22905 [Blastocatellia bacterium]|nr:hypothetical protein [Blastocatellia bacterium]